MKPLPIGVDNFESIIKGNMYYVDKTNIIAELLKSKIEVILFSRPRRFGKSLFMSMLENFFDIDKKEKNKNLFVGLNISKSEYYSELSKYPVISLDFKDIKASTYEETFNMFKLFMSSLYRQKDYITEVLNEEEKEKFNLIINEKATEEIYKVSIKLLSNWLERYHKEKVIILIDEYDAGINESYIRGYYEELMNLIQPLLSSAFKGNDSLKLGVLTGVLRIGGASLFSSFNNLDVYDVMSEGYNEYFGFTESETKELLESYGLELTSEVKEYYDGYSFSGLHIYNPWSILNYANRKALEPYWISTGSNKLIKELLSKVSDKAKIEELIQGRSIIFKYDKSVNYESFTTPDNLNNLLNLLLVSGYVTFDKRKEDMFAQEDYFKIPNKEVKEDFIRVIESVTYKDYLNTNENYKKFIMSFVANDKEYIEKFLNEVLPSISYYDFYENFYHGYTLGLFSMLLNNSKWVVKSNRESGNGRYDVSILNNENKIGIIIEFKISEESEMEEKALEGLKQMKEKEYYKELKLAGIEDIKEYVIVFSKKKAIVR